MKKVIVDILLYLGTIILGAIIFSILGIIGQSYGKSVVDGDFIVGHSASCNSCLPFVQTRQLFSWEFE